jgi:hypothetical protein
MYVSHNNEVHLYNHCYSGAISITSSKSVFVALGIQHAMCTLHTVICNLSGSTIFFHIISHGMSFRGKKQREREKKKLLLIKCVLILFYNFA